MTSLYLIRHAQAQGNLRGLFQGTTDYDLTDLGRRQARQLAERFAAVPIEAVYSSPLRRARQTAELLARRKELPLGIDPGLVEIDGGEWEDRPLEELVRLYPAQFEKFIHLPHEFENMGGESPRQVYDRIVPAVLRLIREHRGWSIAAVSHGWAIRCVLCHAYGYSFERLGEIGWGHNTAVTHITFDRRETPLVHRENDVTHLPEGMLGQNAPREREEAAV